jgi:acetyltransferase-like isoleucine patch superfamily enzyme
MNKSIWQRVLNRVLHWVARQAPGSTSLRPFLHRLRGVTIQKGVFIGDEVYLENEYPECVEIHENVSISMRVILIAHTRTPGKIIIEKDSFVGPNAVICSQDGSVIRIGQGAVVAAGSVVTTSVAPKIMVAPPPTRPVARVLVPLTKEATFKEFLAGIAPLHVKKEHPTE